MSSRVHVGSLVAISRREYTSALSIALDSLSGYSLLLPIESVPNATCNLDRPSDRPRGCDRMLVHLYYYPQTELTQISTERMLPVWQMHGDIHFYTHVPSYTDSSPRGC